ncbi:carbon-nitrogen hydrolase family protein [Peribacillus deserti]|uniref:carbon-nitrogen hydrolase family protein n=1 Tax=Peribacillus deserti TaxID=673318 RepID=UPI0015E085AA|nr:carbon-nitrogen hydrolase family protein [Peribacillus deserti]
MKAGIQMCREIRFPEQWRHLAVHGAEVIFYLTNVKGEDNFPVWNSHLISRAAENQRFIISSNIAASEQGCSSMAVSPKGNILTELPAGEEAVQKVVIDLTEVSDWYLSQSRMDLM